MISKHFFTLCLTFAVSFSFAQEQKQPTQQPPSGTSKPSQGQSPQGQTPGQGQHRGGQGRSATGNLYGKVLDAKTGKPIEFAPVQLFTTKFDSVKNESKQVLAGGQLTLANGDFNIENVPAAGKYTLRITAIGYQKYEQSVAFDKPKQSGGQGMSAIAKDLGNIKLRTDSHLLAEVVVDGSDPGFHLEFDKKVYNVDKNPVSTGQTAQEVLKNVPSVNVDMDGNVTMRNAAPQIFVDGRPTTLSLDQIPADAIENIELITNPSAKFDAASGMGGIINIVMKKNRKLGYHGSVRGGVDMRGRVNGGGDFNVHQGKFNFFANGHANQRYSIGRSVTTRTGLQDPVVNTEQINENFNKGYFMMGKIGFDYFMDIRNTFTLSASMHRGGFNPVEELDTRTETFLNGSPLVSDYLRVSDNERKFYNFNGSLQYKHLFPKEGQELTADVNVSKVDGGTDGLYVTQYFDADNNLIGNPILQKQSGGGGNIFTTVQTDYVDMLSEKLKMETGLRASIRTFDSRNKTMYFNYGVNDFIEAPALTSNYSYTDQVYAAYSTFTTALGKLNTQAGLRVESSDYSGFLPDSNLTFKVAYPVSLFPSAFASYKLNESNDVQFTYSRKINRPNFFQLIPFTDYSDSLNFKRGNAALRPEFINALELSWQKTISRGNSVLASVYHKTVTNIVTGYQVLEYSSVYDREVIINTFENAKYGRSYGGEITTRNNFFKFIDLTLNFNIYNSEVNATNVRPDLKNQMWSYFGKANMNIRLPKNISFQVSADYQSKTAIPVSSGGGYRMGGGGGGGWGGSPSSSVQGYNWRGSQVDLAVRKDFLKNRAASITLSVSDVLKSEIHRSHVVTDYFIQDSERRRDQRFFRLNFNYRFGKMDTNLFRRKNNRVNTDGMDMM